MTFVVIHHENFIRHWFPRVIDSLVFSRLRHNVRVPTKQCLQSSIQWKILHKADHYMAHISQSFCRILSYLKGVNNDFNFLANLNLKEFKERNISGIFSKLNQELHTDFQNLRLVFIDSYIQDSFIDFRYHSHKLIILAF